MSRRKQAKPKSTRSKLTRPASAEWPVPMQTTVSGPDDDPGLTYEVEESNGRSPVINNRLIADQPVDDWDIDGALEPVQQYHVEVAAQPDLDQEADDDGDRDSMASGRSSSGTPPTPGNGLTHHDCSYCEAAFGSFFLLKQHEQDNHAHLMPFKCRYCAKGFKHKRSHDRHEKSHSGIRKHKCAHCGQAFFRSDHLKLHLKTHETSKYSFVCVLCQRGFHSSAGLEAHLQMHEKQKRSTVNDAHLMSSSDNAGSRIDAQAIDTGPSTPLDYASKGSSPADPKIGVPSFNTTGQSQCSVCSATFKTPELLLRHMDTNHRIFKSRLESPSPSRFGQKLTPPPLFAFPTSQPPASTSLVCPYCQAGDFFSEEALELHLQALHGANLNRNGSVTPIDRKWTSPVSTYGCGICGQAFLDIGLLQKHTLNSHTLKDLDNDSQVSDGSKLSSRHFMGSGSRIGLVRSADPIYECQTCGRTFDSILALHGHASSVHGSLPEHVATPASDSSPFPKSPFINGDYEPSCGNSEKRSTTTQPVHQLYQCGQCDEMVFTDLSAFSAHMRQHVQPLRHAPTEKPPSSSGVQEHFSCDMCGAQFGMESARDAHSAKHYLQKENQYSCKSCTKTFAVPDELQKHLLDMHAIHLYRCSLCKEIFESRVDIQVHFAVGHSDEVVRLRCRSCNAAFLSEEQFNAHVQAVHFNRRCKSRDRSSSGAGDKSEMGQPFDFPNGGEAPFCCVFCNDAFSVEYLYEKHLESAHRAQMEMFMLNGFIPKASVSQLLMQAAKFKGPYVHGDSVGGGRTMWSAASEASMFVPSHGSTPLVNPTTIIKCNICDRRCDTMLELAEHKLQHCKVIHSQKCSFCQEPISSVAEFHAHTRQHNAGNGIPMSCIVCKQSLVSALDMQTHAKFHLLLSTHPTNSSTTPGSRIGQHCTRCGKQLRVTEAQDDICSDCAKSVDDLMDRQQTSTSVSSASSAGICKCRHCSLKFETVAERNQHECAVHRVEIGGASSSLSPRTPKPYQCIKCQKSFATELEIQAHVTTHVLQDGIHHYCMLCKRVFDSPSKLQCHLIEHSFAGCSEMQCYLCNAIFSLPQPLQQHMLTRHGVDERPYECQFPQCDQKFFFRAELENHAFLHQAHPTTKPPSMAGSTSGDTQIPDVTSPSLPIACPTCGASFSNGMAFSTHLTICDGAGTSKGRSVTNGQQHAVEAVAISNSHMRLDQSQSHTKTSGKNEEGEGSLHYCPHCTKTFHSLSALQGHSHVHMVSKTHQCTKCRKVFPTAAKLRNHQRQHSGDKPFPCTLCMRFFSRKDNLKVHMRIHYKNGSPEVASPEAGTSSGPNAEFPTMVPRASNLLASLSHISMVATPDGYHTPGQRRDSSAMGSNGDHSSDGSATPFEYGAGLFGQPQGRRGSSVDEEQSCRVNED